MRSGDREVQEEEEGGNNLHQYTDTLLCNFDFFLFYMYVY